MQVIGSSATQDSVSSPGKKKSALGLFLLVIGVPLALWAAGFVTHLVGENRELSPVDARLAQECRALNQQCPVMIDGETRGDGASMGPNRTCHYHFTLIHALSSQVDPNQLKEALRPGILEGYRSSPGLKLFRETGVTLVYEYYDANGTHITDIVVAPADLAR